jgi:hypothetical protein
VARVSRENNLDRPRSGQNAGSLSAHVADPHPRLPRRVPLRYAIAIFIAALAAGAVALFWPVSSKSINRPRLPNAPEQNVAKQASTVPAPRMPFRDVTAESGVRFVHENGAAGEKLLPETMGGGVAFLDFDGDGDQDLLFVNGTHWPSKPGAEGEKPPTATLYRRTVAIFILCDVATNRCRIFAVDDQHQQIVVVPAADTGPSVPTRVAGGRCLAAAARK